MPTPIVFELIKQLFHKPTTNCFPVKYHPGKTTVTDLINKVQDGQAEINPPVTIPEKFRGKIDYNKESKKTVEKICYNIFSSINSGETSFIISDNISYIYEKLKQAYSRQKRRQINTR